MKSEKKEKVYSILQHTSLNISRRCGCMTFAVIELKQKSETLTKNYPIGV